MIANTSKTKDTKLAYIKRAETFVKQYQKKYKQEPGPDQLADFVICKSNSVSNATWRQYKNSTIFFLESLNIDTSDSVEKLVACKKHKDTIIPTRTSGLKRKYVSKNEEDKLRILLRQASKLDNGWGRTMYCFFETIISTAVRPIEISQSKVADTQQQLVRMGHKTTDYTSAYPCLIVQNAKNTNGRTFGEHRFIDISSLSDKKQLLIKAAIVMAKNMNTPTGVSATYDDFYKKLRNAFYRFMQFNFTGKSKRITLYSFRHQAIADLKYSGCSLPEIAALVGHGSDATATEHYGKKRVGRTREVLVNANLVDVEKVRRVHSTNPHTIPSSKDISNINTL